MRAFDAAWSVLKAFEEDRFRSEPYGAYGNVSSHQTLHPAIAGMQQGIGEGREGFPMEDVGLSSKYGRGDGAMRQVLYDKKEPYSPGSMSMRTVSRRTEPRSSMEDPEKLKRDPYYKIHRREPDQRTQAEFGSPHEVMQNMLNMNRRGYGHTPPLTEEDVARMGFFRQMLQPAPPLSPDASRAERIEHKYNRNYQPQPLPKRGQPGYRDRPKMLKPGHNFIPDFRGL